MADLTEVWLLVIEYERGWSWLRLKGCGLMARVLDFALYVNTLSSFSAVMSLGMAPLSIGNFPSSEGVKDGEGVGLWPKMSLELVVGVINGIERGSVFIVQRRLLPRAHS